MVTVKWKQSRTHRHKLYLTVISTHFLFLSVNCFLFIYNHGARAVCRTEQCWKFLASPPSHLPSKCVHLTCICVCVCVCVCAYTQDGMCAWLHTQKHNNCPVLGDVWAWASASSEPALHLWMEGDICERWRWCGVMWGLRNKIVTGSMRDMHIWRTSSVTVVVTGTTLHTKSCLACSNKQHGLSNREAVFGLTAIICFGWPVTVTSFYLFTTSATLLIVLSVMFLSIETQESSE